MFKHAYFTSITKQDTGLEIRQISEWPKMATAEDFAVAIGHDSDHRSNHYIIY